MWWKWCGVRYNVHTGVKCSGGGIYYIVVVRYSKRKFTDKLRLHSYTGKWASELALGRILNKQE